MFPCLDPLELLVCSSRDHSLTIGEEKTSVAISGRSSHKMTGLMVLVHINNDFTIYGKALQTVAAPREISCFHTLPCL